METQNQITWPTLQQQIDYWNKKEGEELERVSRIQEAESRDATNETREVDWKALAGQLADDMREIRDMAHSRGTRVNMQNGVSLGAFAGVSLNLWEKQIS